MEMTHTVYFNSKHTYSSSREGDDSEDDADGPVVDRHCPQCQNNKMSYATLQLRSADEGQTVFYTCTKCKYVSAAIFIIDIVLRLLLPKFINFVLLNWIFSC